MSNLVGTGRARTSNLLDEEIVTACRKRFELKNHVSFIKVRESLHGFRGVMPSDALAT